MMASRRTRLVVAATAIALVAGLGVTQRFDSAEAAATRALEVTPAKVPRSGSVLPGGSGDVVFRVRNRNSFDVEVTTIEQSGTILANLDSCDTSKAFVFGQQSGTWVIAARKSLTIILDDAITMSANAGNECAGASITIPVAVTGLEIVEPPP